MYKVEAPDGEHDALVDAEAAVADDTGPDTPDDTSRAQPDTNTRDDAAPKRHVIPTNDAGIRRTVNRRLAERPDLAPYIETLVTQALLARHHKTISARLNRDGVLTKQGEPKKALRAVLDIADKIMRIDAMLPAPPQAARGPVQVSIVSVCPKCQEVPADAVSVFDDSGSRDDLSGVGRPPAEDAPVDEPRAIEPDDVIPGRGRRHPGLAGLSPTEGPQRASNAEGATEHSPRRKSYVGVYSEGAQDAGLDPEEVYADGACEYRVD